MAYLGWMSYAGTEAISNARVAAYAQGVNVQCSCDTLPEALGDDLYQSPAEDPAPWYEPNTPESGEFWGVLGLEIHGASQSTLSRTWTDLIGDGAVPGASRRNAREIEFKVMLLAQTEAGLSYGISWLASVLRGSACATGCGGDTLCLLAGCPEPPPAADETDSCLPESDAERERQARTNLPSPQPTKPPPDRETHLPPKPPPGGNGGKPPPPSPGKGAAAPPAKPGWPPADQGPPPRGGRLGPPDPAVMRTIFLVGKERGANSKVMLAAFETGLVESNLSNVNYGDRDSVGVFQQRPSQGWCDDPARCMNVNHAAHKFFDQAIPKDAENKDQTPGQLAQSVQRSAHPERYDKREGQAKQLINDTRARIEQEKPQPPPPPKPPPNEGDGKPPPPKPSPGPGKPPTPPPHGGNGGNPPPPQQTPPAAPEDNDTTPWGEWDAYRAADDLIRTIYDVALLEFADDEERGRISGAWTATLTFTVKAGNPAWYSEPVTVIDTRHPDKHAPPAVQDVLPNYRIDTVTECPEPTDCLTNSPYLAAGGPWGDEPFPGSTPGDPIWRDPGYPVHPFTAARAVYHSPGDLTPGWFEKVPIITLYTGRHEMHRITTRFYENPRDKPAGPQLDPCDACTEITLPWAPPRTRVTLDGRTRTTEVKCADGNILTSDVVLYGPLGALLEWPEFDCGTPMIIEMIAQHGTVAPDSWWRVEWAAKMDGI